jgi:hypothetical protein
MLLLSRKWLKRAACLYFWLKILELSESWHLQAIFIDQVYFG